MCPSIHFSFIMSDSCIKWTPMTQIQQQTFLMVKLLPLPIHLEIRKSQPYVLQEGKRKDHPIPAMHTAGTKRSPLWLLKTLNLITNFQCQLKQEEVCNIMCPDFEHDVPVVSELTLAKLSVSRIFSTNICNAAQRVNEILIN